MSSKTVISTPAITPLCPQVYHKGKQTIDSKTQIEITCDSPGAVIYFTVNGRTPEPFETWNLSKVTLRYSKPFVLKSSAKPRTVKAVAVIEKSKQKSAIVTKSFQVVASSASAKGEKEVTVVSDDGPGNPHGGSEEEPSEKYCGTMDANVEAQEVNRRDSGEVRGMDNAEEAIPPEDTGFAEIPEPSVEPTDVATDDRCSPVEQEEEMSELHAQSSNQKNAEIDVDSAGDDILPMKDDVRNPLDFLADSESHQQEHFESQEEPENKDRESMDNYANEGNTSEPERNIVPNEIKHVDRGVQAVAETFDQTLQAVPETFDQNTQTDPEAKTSPVRNPAPEVQVVSKKVGTECSTEVKASQTTEPEEKLYVEQGSQTGPSKIQRISNPLVKGSPGRGYWRQQIDHIATQLKTEAYNNVDFQDMISQPSLAQINHVNVHEGLDELILVVNIAVKRPVMRR